MKYLVGEDGGLRIVGAQDWWFLGPWVVFQGTGGGEMLTLRINSGKNDYDC
jgi:hypothetical protein